MRDWLSPEPDEIPDPTLVAAAVSLGFVPPERVPVWAAYWLVLGYDGEDLRTLAGLSGSDPREVHDTLPAALADCGAAIPDSVTSAAQVAFVKLARMHAENRAAESWVLDKVSEIVLGCDGAAGVTQLPLGRIFDLADEWGTYRSRPERTLRREIRAACRAQLAAAEATPPPTRPRWSPWKT